MFGKFIHSVSFAGVFLSISALGAHAQGTVDSLGRFESESPIFFNSIVHPGDPGPVLKSGVRYSFSEKELAGLVQDSGSKVIVHHGPPVERQGFFVVFAHEETLPVFLNEGSGKESLSYVELQGIADGSVRSWADIGGSDLPVAAYGPDGTLRPRALEMQFEAAQFELGLSMSGRGDYDFLAERVKTVPGAVSFGLRSSPAAALVENSRNIGFVPRGPDGDLLFRVPIYLYIAEDDPSALAAADAVVSLASERAARDGMKYPAAKLRKQIFAK